MPSAVSVSAAWRSVVQSDWLPMMLATGFAPMRASAGSVRSAKEAANYRRGSLGGKAKGPPWFPSPGNPSRRTGSGERCPDAGNIVLSGDDVGGQLVLDERNPVAQAEFVFLEALDLQFVRSRRAFQRFDRSIEVAMFLLQARQGRAELAFFLSGHRRDVLCTGRAPFARRTLKPREYRAFRGPASRPHCRAAAFPQIAAVHNRSTIDELPTSWHTWRVRLTI